ncbi:MAG: methyltransferase domain-containing protein [Methylococcales bacterium]|nr:methyltransferase domain-containing protein [Methylococcales bacterium]MDP3840584.1 methyltransferase domain-containing protein [Methylococcales bacterium]
MSTIKEALHGLQRQQTLGATLDHPHYISLSLIGNWLQDVAFSEASGVMLDYGCGGQPYKNFFMPKLSRYIGADVSAADGICLDIEIEPQQALALDGASIDTLLSTQTLEHIEDIEFYISECARLVRPDGVLILTAPMQWRHHEVPYDYWRFTRYGLISLLERHGFSIKSISPCGGVYALIGQIFLSHLHERGVRKKWLNKMVNWFSLYLNQHWNDTEDTLNWMCIAIRN